MPGKNEKAGQRPKKVREDREARSGGLSRKKNITDQDERHATSSVHNHESIKNGSTHLQEKTWRVAVHLIIVLNVYRLEK